MLISFASLRAWSVQFSCIDILFCRQVGFVYTLEQFVLEAAAEERSWPRWALRRLRGRS